MSVEDGSKPEDIQTWTSEFGDVIYRRVNGITTAYDTLTYQIYDVPDVDRVKPEDIKPTQTSYDPYDPNEGVTRQNGWIIDGKTYTAIKDLNYQP